MPDRLSSLRGNIDPVLSNVAVGFKFPENAGFALFPVVPHNKSDGKIAVFGKESFRLANSKRGVGADTKNVSFAVDYMAINLNRRSLSNSVDEIEITEADDPIKTKLMLEKGRLERLQGQIGIEVEYEQAVMAQTHTNYSSTHKKSLDGTTNKKWSDYVNGDPIADIDAAKKVIASSIGTEPNLLVISYDVWVKLKRHPKMLAQVPVSNVQTLTAQLLQNIVEIPKIVVAKSVYSADGKTMTDIWSGTAILAYVPNNPISTEEPSFGYTARKIGYPKVDTYIDHSRTSEIVRVEDYLGAAIVCQDAGYLIYNAI